MELYKKLLGEDFAPSVGNVQSRIERNLSKIDLSK